MAVSGTYTAVAGAAVALALLSACSRAADADHTQLDPGGSHLVVNGEQIAVRAAATCTDRPDGLLLILAEDQPDAAEPKDLQGFEILLANDRSEIRRVLVVTPEMKIIHDKGGSLRKVDDTYVVSGEGLDLAASDSLNDRTTRSFEISVRCP